MKSRISKAAIGLALACGTAQAAGPLYLQGTSPPRPYVWDTSKGSIPVWTDGGGAFTYDFDGVTPFITIERANEITQFAFDQWSDVPTATLPGGRRGHDQEQDRRRRRHRRQCRAVLREAERLRLLGALRHRRLDPRGVLRRFTLRRARHRVPRVDRRRRPHHRGHGAAERLVRGRERHRGQLRRRRLHARVRPRDQPFALAGQRADGVLELHLPSVLPGRAGLRRAGAFVGPLGRRGREPRRPGHHRDDVSVHQQPRPSLARSRARSRTRTTSRASRTCIPRPATVRRRARSAASLRLKDGRTPVQRHQRHRAQRQRPAARRRVGHDRRPDAGTRRSRWPLHDQQPDAGPGLRGLHRGDRRGRLPDRRRTCWSRRASTGTWPRAAIRPRTVRATRRRSAPRRASRRRRTSRSTATSRACSSRRSSART